MRKISYREAVGGLMWIGTMNRPALSFAAHSLAEHSDNPVPARWRAASKASSSIFEGIFEGTPVPQADSGLFSRIGGTDPTDVKLSAWVD